MSRKVKISEICDVFDGPHATPKKIESGPVYLGIKAITKDGTIDEKEFAYLSKADYIKWTKRVVPKKDDIVFSYEATLHRYALIPENFYGCLGRRLAIVRAKTPDVNIHWLYYFFMSSKWTQFINNHIVSGSTVNRISIDDFPDYIIDLPNIKTQNSIALFLENITQKIQLNKKINSELETMAKTIYDYWFVQFDFPDENGNPYKSSGGEMEYNETLKCEIPKGWEVKKLKDIANTISGYPFETTSYVNIGKYKLLTIKNVQDGYINSTVDNYIETLPNNIPDYCKLKKQDILVSLTGNVGRVALMYEDNCLLNQRVGIVIPTQEKCKGFAYFSFKSDFINKKLKKISTGTSQKNLSPIDTGNIDVVLPNSETLQKFSVISENVINTTVNNMAQNLELTKLRDWLLPMLMNGQATVE